MKTGVEMLACPMCGGRADTGGHTGTIYVECQVCGVLGSCAIDEDGAIVAWNTRQTHPAATGSVREAVDDEDKIADMIGFGASETAPYLYPEPDQQLVRAAYCEGAAQGARALLRWQADALAAALTPDAAARKSWHPSMAPGLTVQFDASDPKTFTVDDEGKIATMGKPIMASDAAASDAPVPAGEARKGCIGTMNPARATYFLERFKREEKLLGPHEQWALDYTIAMLAAASKVASDTDAYFAAHPSTQEGGK